MATLDPELGAGPRYRPPVQTQALWVMLIPLDQGGHGLACSPTCPLHLLYAQQLQML